MNDTQNPDGQEGVKDKKLTENIINEQEINRDHMRRGERVSYSALGGAIIAISVILFLALIVAKLIDVTILTVAIISGILGFYLIYEVAYRKR